MSSEVMELADHVLGAKTKGEVGAEDQGNGRGEEGIEINLGSVGVSVLKRVSSSNLDKGNSSVSRDGEASLSSKSVASPSLTQPEAASRPSNRPRKLSRSVALRTEGLSETELWSLWGAKRFKAKIKGWLIQPENMSRIMAIENASKARRGLRRGSIGSSMSALVGLMRKTPESDLSDHSAVDRSVHSLGEGGKVSENKSKSASTCAGPLAIFFRGLRTKQGSKSSDRESRGDLSGSNKHECNIFDWFEAKTDDSPSTPTAPTTPVTKAKGSWKNPWRSWGKESAQTPVHEEAGLCIDGVGNLIIVKIVTVKPTSGSESLSGVGPKSYVQEMKEEILCNMSHITSCAGSMPRNSSTRHRYILTVKWEDEEPQEIESKESEANGLKIIDQAQNGNVVQESDPLKASAPQSRVLYFGVETKALLDEWVERLKPHVASQRDQNTILFTQIRSAVSGNRKRYSDGIYDLDLSYINPRVIAMAFPGEDTHGPFSIVLRNDLIRVKHFFEEKHRNKYKIFNLCAEKVYDEQKFGVGLVENIPFLDHHPPTLRQMKAFCQIADRWCRKKNSVIAVHCKGGKGRTGVMVCSWLLLKGQAGIAGSFETSSFDGSKCSFDGLRQSSFDGDDSRPPKKSSNVEYGADTAEQAIDMFVKKRTENLEINKPQGPTGCSQVRYIKFFERSLHGPVKNRPLVLTKIQIPYVAVSMLHAKSRRESLHKISLHNQMSSDAMELGRKKGSLTDLFSYDCDDPIDESKKKRDAVGESSVRGSSGSLPGPASLSRLRPLLTVCSDQGILFQKTMEYHSGEGLVVDCTMERLLVNEDFRIYVHLARPEPSDSPQKAADKALFFLCTHTGLEKEGSPWVFDKSQLDKCDKDKNHNLFPENFCLKVFYEEVQSPQRYIIFNQDVEINLMKMLTELDHMTTRYGAGEVICHQGSSDTSDLFVVKNGSMRVELIKEGGNAVVLDQDPLMSGEAAFLMGSKRFADIVANEASDVYCLDPEWCHENLSQKDLGTIYLVLCLKIARNLNIANGKLAEQAGRHAVSGRRRRSVESLVDGIKAARTKVSSHLSPCGGGNQDSLQEINRRKRDVYTKRYELPGSETIIAVEACRSSGSLLSTVPENGKLIIMQRHIIFQVRNIAQRVRTGNNYCDFAVVLRPMDVTKVELDESEGDQESLIITYRDMQSSLGKTLRMSLSFFSGPERTAYLLGMLRDLVEGQKNISMRSLVNGKVPTADLVAMGASVILPELFKPRKSTVAGEDIDDAGIARCSIKTHKPGSIINKGADAFKMGCVLEGFAVLKTGQVVADRLEPGDMYGGVTMIEQASAQRATTSVVVAGQQGCKVAMVPYEQARHLIERDPNYACRFYEYLAKVLMRRTRDVHWMYHPKAEGVDPQISRLSHKKRTKSSTRLLSRPKTGRFSPIRGLTRFLTPIRDTGNSSIDSAAAASLSELDLGAKSSDQDAGTARARSPRAESPDASFKQALTMPISQNTSDLARRDASSVAGDLTVLRSDGPECVESHRSCVGSGDIKSIASVRGSMEGDILGIEDRDNPLLYSRAALGKRFGGNGSNLSGRSGNSNLERLDGSIGNLGGSNLSFWRGGSFDESFTDNFSPTSVQSNASPNGRAVKGGPTVPIDSIIME